MHRYYAKLFGIHSDLWTFLRILIDLHERKTIEENSLVLGGNHPTRQAARVRHKEVLLQHLKDNLRDNGPMTLPLIYNYVSAGAFNMRRYHFAPVPVEDNN